MVFLGKSYPDHTIIDNYCENLGKGASWGLGWSPRGTIFDPTPSEKIATPLKHQTGR